MAPTHLHRCLRVFGPEYAVLCCAGLNVNPPSSMIYIHTIRAPMVDGSVSLSECGPWIVLGCQFLRGPSICGRGRCGSVCLLQFNSMACVWDQSSWEVLYAIIPGSTPFYRLCHIYFTFLYPFTLWQWSSTCSPWFNADAFEATMANAGKMIDVWILHRSQIE